MSPENKLPETTTIPIFPIIRKTTGLRLREGSEMEYALSLVTDSQPQINLLGQNGDRITKDQSDMVVEGIKNTELKWKDLIALERSIPSSSAEKDWQRNSS